MKSLKCNHSIKSKISTIVGVLCIFLIVLITKMLKPEERFQNEVYSKAKNKKMFHKKFIVFAVIVKFKKEIVRYYLNILVKEGGIDSLEFA